MHSQKEPIKLYVTPPLRRPYVIAAWAGMGAVALLATNYLRQQLNARLLGEIDPYSFFSPTQVSIENGLIQEPEFPETKLYYWDEGRDHDLILLAGTVQPTNTYDMAQQVVRLAQEFDAERIYTAAAFPTFIHHTATPGIRATATARHLLSELLPTQASVLEQGTIGGLNGLLLAVAREHDVEGMCLLGEIPIYATQMINPQAAHAVLTVLTRMIEVEIDLDKLTLWAQDLRPQMDKLYQILPDQVKETIKRGQEHPPAAAEPEQPLVADEAFFSEIEQFLQDQWNKGNSQDKEDEDTP